MSITDANLEKFQIPLEEIKSATEDFHKKNKIVGGEYSKLYRGQLSESLGNRTAAFKRFIKDRCDGKKEFLNELKFISNLNHENIVSFLGYCDEGEEMIMVYEYPVNGSLANYFKETDKWSRLTWQRRLEICMDAARGLNYLHSGLGQHERLIHGSFMHSNILLDDNLKAKICGFEISELIPGNQPCQQVYKPHTNGMISHKDPIYLETGFLKAESDIYSFGVQLFRILTWPEGFARVSNGADDFMRNRLTMTIQHYYHNRLDSFIDPAIRDQIDGPSFRMIEEIICKCLSFDIKDRPTMDTVVKTIKDALDIHKKYATEILEQAHMLNCNPCRTPIDTEKKLGPEGSLVTDPTLYRSLAGSLYAMKRVLRYLRGTTDLELQLFRSTTSQLIAYSNADWAGDMANSGTGFDATHVDQNVTNAQ
nr:protein kinase, ATP binding site-containing protein [Tanacetum cinerariifolium]